LASLGALRNVENVQKALGAKSTRIEVVSHGKGLGMLLAKTVSTNPDMKATLEKLHATGVIFAVCVRGNRSLVVTVTAGVALLAVLMIVYMLLTARSQ
jgi:intracellular sulfur oxidation DsrE/DsrF family protein